MRVKYIYAPLPFIMAQENLDITELVLLLKEHNFKGMMFHVNSIFCNNDEEFTYFGKKSKEWKQQFSDLVQAFADAGLILVLTIHDQYAHNPKYLNLNKKKPNTVLKNIDEDLLYSSIKGSFGPTASDTLRKSKFEHLAWFYQDEIHPSKYSEVGQYGDKIWGQIRFIFSEMAKAQQRTRRFKAIVVLQNEEFTELSANKIGGQYKKAGGRGGQDKTKFYMRYLMEKAGLVLGRKVKTAVNHMVFISGQRGNLISKDGTVNVHPQFFKNLASVHGKVDLNDLGHYKGLNSLIDIHGIDNLEVIKMLQKGMGGYKIKFPFTMLNRDASPDDDSGMDEIIPYLEDNDIKTYMVIKAGTAGKHTEQYVGNQNKFHKEAIPLCDPARWRK